MRTLTTVSTSLLFNIIPLILTRIAVVSLLIVNSYDNFSPAQYDTVFKAVGLDTMAYSPPSASLTYTQWPTLGELINNGTRLVVFLTTQADYNSVPYLIDGWCPI